MECCQCCHSEVDVVKTNNGMPKGHYRREEMYLCYVCRATHIGNVYMFPEQYRGDAALILAKIMAECTHLILKAIREGKQ